MDRMDETLREIEASERWLAQFETPGPRDEAVANAKRAARNELNRRRVSPKVSRWRSWHGAVAAAAVIAFSVGVAWYSSQEFGVDRIARVEPAGQPVVGETGDVLVVLTVDDDELSELEAWSAELDGYDVGAVYDELVDAFEDSPGGDQQPAGTSRLDRPSVKVSEDAA